MKNIKKAMMICMFFALAAGCAGRRMEEGSLLLPNAQDGVLEDGADSPDGGEGGQSPDASGGSSQRSQGSFASGEDGGAAAVIYVQVAGAVHKPGVYELPEGSRVFQAIELAGGLAADAQVKSLNQAASLADGEMIWVMTMEEAAAQPSQEALDESPDDGKVNLNTATKEELMGLPGIGEAKAARIVAFREENGSFKQIEDLMKIEGIKEGVFSKIEDFVKVQ